MSSCPRDIEQYVSNEFDKKALEKGLQPLKIANELQKVTRSGRPYGGMKGGACSWKAKVLTAGLLAAGALGADKVLCYLGGPAWTSFLGTLSTRSTSYVVGMMKVLEGSLLMGDFSALYVVVQKMMTDITTGIGAVVLAKWAGAVKVLTALCEWIDSCITAKANGEPEPKPPAIPTKEDVEPTTEGGRRRRRSRKAGSRRSRRGGSCGAKVGGRRRRRSRKAGSRRSRRGGSCGAKVGGRRRTRNRKAGSRRSRRGGFSECSKNASDDPNVLCTAST